MDSEPLKQLLLRGWMTHDAMWFKNTPDRFGIETATELNRAAIRDMAPFAMGFNPRLRLERTQTIMEGADHCDFRYYLEEVESSAARGDGP